MTTGTGVTIYEQIVSVSEDNIPVTGATFDIEVYNNGIADALTSVSITLSDSTRGIFTASWSASSVGNYQIYAKNNITSVIFISNNVIVKSDEELDTNVYIGF